MQFGPDIRGDDLADATRADYGQALDLATNEGADERHWVVHVSEPANDNDVAVFNESGRLLFAQEHLFAIRPIGAGDRMKLHGVSSAMQNDGVAFSLACAITRELMGGGSEPLKRPSTRRPSSSSTRSRTKGPLPASCCP